MFRHMIEDTLPSAEQPGTEAHKPSPSKASRSKEKEKERNKPTSSKACLKCVCVCVQNVKILGLCLHLVSSELLKDKGSTTKMSLHVFVQSLDETKPHWMLRVVSERAEAEQIEVKKDTERLEQIKAMKLAWESAEPGRAAKVCGDIHTHTHTYRVECIQIHNTQYVLVGGARCRFAGISHSSELPEKTEDA